MASYFTHNDQTWFSLPLRIRQQWWRDTDYGRLPPTKAMCETLAMECRLLIFGPYRDGECELQWIENE